MAPEEQTPSGVTSSSRMPPSMQLLRERIGGLKAASESELSRIATSSDLQAYQHHTDPSEQKVLLERSFRQVEPSTSQSCRRKSTWESELEEYLRASSDSAAALELQDRLESPEAWLRFLQKEEALRQAGGQFQVGIGRLYEWATKAIPRSLNAGNEDYVRIWTGYAKQQMESSEEDARQVFKYLKSHHIGQSLACLYEEWALLEVAAGQGQKALHKVQEGIRLQAAPAGRLERLQAKLLASMPGDNSNMVGQPSPLLHASSLDKKTARALHDTPSLKQQQGTPAVHKHQPYQPCLQAIPSPACQSNTPLLGRAAPAPIATQQLKVHPPAEHRHSEVLVQYEGQEAYKGNFSTPLGKGASTSLGPLPLEGTANLGMPTPSFGLGTSTLGKPGGFKFDDTAHSAAGSSFLSADGKETGYAHTTHSVGGRSSIGSSFRWQPSPTSLLTRQITTSVSSRGGAETTKSASDLHWSLIDENVKEGATKMSQRAAMDPLRRIAEPALKGPEKHLGQESDCTAPVVVGAASMSNLPALEEGGGQVETHSSGGSVSPTDTIEVFKEADAFQELKAGSQKRPGTPVRGAKKHSSTLLGREQLSAGSATSVAEQCEADDTPAEGVLALEGLSQIPHKNRGAFQEPKSLYSTPVSDVRLKSVPLERPLWMREPLLKAGPTLSPVEETSKERASNTTSSSRTGSKSSGSSSVKSRATSRGDEETVSLSKAAGVQGPGPESQKRAAPQSAVTEKRGGTPTTAKQGAQLRRLGLLGKAKRVVGAEDTLSSAESTEDLSLVKEHEDLRRPTEVLSMGWQAKKLPSDEELLRKMEEAASKESVRRTDESGPSLGGGARRAFVAEPSHSRDGGDKEAPHTQEEGRSEFRKQAATGEEFVRKAEQAKENAAHEASLQPVIVLDVRRTMTALTDVRHPQPPARCDSASVGTARSGVEPRSNSSAPQSLRTEERPRSRVGAPEEQADGSARASSEANLPPAVVVQPQPAYHEARQSTPSSSRLPQEARLPEHEQKDRQEAQKARHVQSRAPNESPAGTPRGQSAHRENGVFWLKGKRYQKLKCVGKGGSSKVWKVIGPDRNEFALKVIDLGNTSAETRMGFIKEIELLKKLQKRRNIIRYIDSEVCKSEVYVLLEFGEIDLANLLKKEQQKALEKGSKCVDENFMRQAWQQMLEAVHSVHQERVVHSDLKPANFLSVLGELKLIDFGIASAMVEESTCIQQRENPMGTINYMAPEAAKFPGPGEPPVRVSRPSDVWSLGCILYQMAYGQTPFAHLSIPQKVLALGCKHKIDFPALRNPHLLDTIQRCLEYNPERRITIPELLRHPFLRPENAPVISPPLPSSSGAVAFSEQQIQSILAMVATAAPSVNIDIQKMLQTLTSQAGSGLAAAIQAAAVKAPPRAPPPPPPPLPAASKARALPRAPLLPVKRQPLAEKARPGNGLQGDLAAQVAKLAAERSKRIESAAANGAAGKGVEVAFGAERSGSRLIGGSVGSGEENKENAGDYQSLLQHKLASRRRMMEEDLTDGSTATMSFA